MAGSPIDQAIVALRVSEGNILSQWHCAGREVFEPFGPWLALVREAAERLEASRARSPSAREIFAEHIENERRLNQ